MDVDRETEMNLSRREVRVLLLHEFLRGHKATEATNNICRTMNHDIISIRRHSIGSIGSTMGILNWTIHLGVEDRSKWIWID